ncbi:diphthine--ammonia ligase [Methanococcoides sp. SA1]|nr:diphthine--ammonia ligase [Methanococcoides sp. SA1]
MRLAVLFSGGKDSTLAAYMAKSHGHKLSCLVSIVSENKDSFMFHTPSIEKVKAQAKVMKVPLIFKKSKGVEEEEVIDLEKAIVRAVNRHKIKGVVTGAVGSVYQASRVQKICNKLGIECFNPLWQKDQIELLEDLIREKFEVVVVGVAAYPLGQEFLGKKVHKDFVDEMKLFQEKFEINPAGEGGEFESFVLNCPLFEKGLKVKSYQDFGEGNSWRRELKI